MIIFFLFYLISLIWLLHIRTLDKDKTVDRERDITFVIDKIYDVGSIIVTLDSIIATTNNNLVNIILIDNTKQDLNSITKEYQKRFISIKVIKNNSTKYFNFLEDIEKEKYNSNEFIVIKSGIIISNKFFNSIYHAIYQMKETIIFLPISIQGNSKINSFLQLYNFLMQSLESSLINKKILVKKISQSDGYIVRSDNFNKNAKNNVTYEDGNIISDIDNQASIIDTDLKLIKIYNEGEPSYDLGYFKILFFISNLLLIVSIWNYIVEPNIILFLAIGLKIIPEFVLIYSYYNKLSYKFPKFEFIIFSIVHPFYMLYEIYNKRGPHLFK